MIIGISGKKQHGKDTISDIIQFLIMEHRLSSNNIMSIKREGFTNSSPTFSLDIFRGWYNIDKENYSGWKIKRFADKLKDIVCLLIGCTREQLEDNDFKEKELGEEWKVWFWTHYKFPSPRISGLFASEEEALALRVDNKTIPEVFGNSSRISSCELTPRLLLQLIGTECGRNIIHPNVWINATMSDYRDNILRLKDGFIPEGADFIKVEDYLEKRVKGDSVKLYSRIEASESVYPNWIIPDVRFPNEAQAIKDRDGIIIRVHRDIPIKQYNRTCLDCHQGFDYDRAKLVSPSTTKVILCPHCRSMNHAAVLIEPDNHPSEVSLDDYKGFNYFIDNNGSLDDLVKTVEDILKTEKLI